MNGSNAFDLGTIDHRLLAPEQLERLKWQGMNNARRERSEALHALFDGLGAGLRRAAAATWRGTRKLALWGVNATAGRMSAYQAWRAHKAAIANLQARSDREFADIGLRRSEIKSAVTGIRRDATRGRRGQLLRAFSRADDIERAA